MGSTGVKRLGGGHWLTTAAGLLYVSGDQVQFDDDFAHWQTAVLRLLEIDEEKARSLIESACQHSLSLFGSLPAATHPDKRVASLTAACREVFALPARLPEAPSPPPASWGSAFDGSPPDTIFASSISGNKERMIVGSSALKFAWQIDAKSQLPVPASSVEYNRSYYESPAKAHCGMRDYIRHDDWRMEKARRLLATVTGACAGRPWLSASGQARALDVGSATGYFRRAMAELGFAHFGIDLSADAIAICRDTLGFETWHGTLFDLPRLVGGDRFVFDLITLWDTIEHLDDPLSAAKTLREFLSADGVIVVRTPNLLAFEADILGDMYYSFKLDHIRYFCPQSLERLMLFAGLKQIYVETTSHLFKGFLGADYLYQMGRQLRGADIISIFSL